MRNYSKKTLTTWALVIIFIFLMTFEGLAVSVGKNITVYFNEIKLMIDGKIVTPKDANGNTVEPFIYNGTTYLPVRAVADALGQDVNWDADTATVVIGKYDKKESLYPDVKLKDMDYLYKDGFSSFSESINDNFGDTYNGYSYLYSTKEFTWQEFNSKVGYALNSKYSKLKGTLILPYNYRSKENLKGIIEFVVDEKVVETINLLSSGDSPVDFVIDLENANILEIRTSNLDAKYNSIVNAGFYK